MIGNINEIMNDLNHFTLKPTTAKSRVFSMQYTCEKMIGYEPSGHYSLATPVSGVVSYGMLFILAYVRSCYY
jgi:hypothetical protein